MGDDAYAMVRGSMEVPSDGLLIDDIKALVREPEKLYQHFESSTDAVRGELLSALDSLAEGARADRWVAVDGYLALRSQLDWTVGEGVRRARWVLEGNTPRTETLRAFARHVATVATGSLSWLAGLIEAQCAATAGELEVAVETAEAIFAKVHGGGDHLEFKVAASLSQLFVLRSQEIEGLVLARHAERLVHELDLDLAAQCLVQLRVCHALSRLGTPDQRLALELNHLAQLNRSNQDELRWIYDTWCLGARAQMASRAGDGEEALQFIERLEQELPEEAAQIWSPEILIVLKSNVAIALERYEESLQELSKQRSLSVSLNGEANFAQDEMLALTRLGRHDEAKSRGRAAIDALPGRSEAERIRIGLSVADLARELEDSELERSALDRAAEAAIHRIQQVHACSKSLPELYDRAEPELSEFRVRFADDHRRFRERITTLLTRHPDLQVDLFPDGQLTCVCAWCQNTRIGESWVPIGHLLTSRPGLRITHGICPNCAVSVDAETEMRLPVNPKSH